MRLAGNCLEAGIFILVPRIFSASPRELRIYQTQCAITLRCEEQMSEGITLPQGGGGVTGPFALGLAVHVRVCRGRR